MKTFYLLLIFCFCSLISAAQWSNQFQSNDKHSLYTSGDYLMGACNGGNLGLNYIYANKISVNLGYTATNKASCSLPDQYLKSGATYTSTNPVEPFENFENLHLMFGGLINLSKKNSIRILLQGGPGLSTQREPDFIVSGNTYNYNMKTTKKVCLVVNPKIEMPLCCTIGFSFGPMVVVNDSQTYIGAGIGLMYGIIKNR